MDSASFQISAWETGSPYKASRHNVRKSVGRSSIESSTDQYADEQFEDEQNGADYDDEGGEDEDEDEDEDEISPDDLLGGGDDKKGGDDVLDIDAAFEQFASAENIVPLQEKPDAMIFEMEQASQEASDDYDDDYDEEQSEDDDDEEEGELERGQELEQGRFGEFDLSPGQLAGDAGGDDEEEEEEEEVDPNVDILGLINEYDNVMGGAMPSSQSPRKSTQAGPVPAPAQSQVLAAPSPSKKSKAQKSSSSYGYQASTRYGVLDEPDEDYGLEDAEEADHYYGGVDGYGDDPAGDEGAAAARRSTKPRRKEYIGLSKSAVKSSGYGPAPPKKENKKSAERVKKRFQAMKEAQQADMLRRREEQMEKFLEQEVRKKDQQHDQQHYGYYNRDDDDEQEEEEQEEVVQRQHSGRKARSKANSKHRQWLEEVAEKRRLEDEALQRQVEMAALKRKKFKEALLEKALRSREEQARHEEDLRNELTGEVLPTFLAPTTAFKVQKMPKKLAPVEISAEELARLEQEKIEQVTKIRRKFKEQHKQLLQQLSVKNEQLKQAEAAGSPERKKVSRRRPEVEDSPGPAADVGAAGSGLAAVRKSSSRSRRERDAAAVAKEEEEAAAAAEKEMRAQRRKEKRERKLREAALADVANGVDEEAAVSAPRRKEQRAPSAPGEEAPKKAAPIRRNRSLTDEGETSAAEEPRQRGKSLKVQAPNSRLYNPTAPAPIVIPETEPAADPEAAAAAAVVSLAKHSEYLKSIADARRQEEADKLKKEERIRKRMQLLRDRLLKETAERKLMAAEDRVRVVVAPDPKPAKKVKPYRPAPPAKKEEAVENDSGDEKPVAKKPPAPRRPPVKKAAESDSSGDSDDSDDSEEETTRRKKPTGAKMSKKGSTLGESTQASNAYSTGYQARDFDDWKRKNGVPEGAKVFVMTGWYPCVKEALIARGWVENPDRDSPFADLKWTLRSIDVNKETLQPWQLTNHFMKNMAITTKAGLIKSLNNLQWSADVHANDIIPRGYDLSTPASMKSFIDDFRCQKAEIVLRMIYKRVTGLDNPLTNAPSSRPATSSVSIDGRSSRPASAAANTCSTPVGASRPGTPTAWTPLPAPTELLCAPEDTKVNRAVFQAACCIVEKLLKLHDFDDMYLDDLSTYNNVNNNANLGVRDGANYGSVLNNNGYPEAVVSALEWELVHSHDVFDNSSPLADKAPEPVDGFLQGEAEKEFVKEHINSSKAIKQYQLYQAKEAKRVLRAEQAARAAAAVAVTEMVSLTQADLQRIHSLLSKLRHYLHKAQANLAGTEVAESKNMWIVKPAAKSRGRGITTFGDLDKLLKYVEAGNGLSTQWVVQKYMENSMTICKRKFDMRQWVLVTDWNPLTIYFYDECYARFSVEEYSTDEANFENAFVHLVNNSIGKNSESHGKTFNTPDGDVVEGHMMSHESLTRYFKSQHGGRDVMKELITPRMQDIAKWSLISASEMIEHRKNSWELYGFDFMVDTDCNAWLIEINSSPACDYSTKITERYVKRALVDILSVVLDTREYEAMSKREREKKGAKQPDIGGWAQIYKGPQMEQPAGSFGAEFGIKGDAIKLPVRRNISFENSGPSSSSIARLSEPRKAPARGAGGDSSEAVFEPKEVCNKENVSTRAGRKAMPTATVQFTISEPQTQDHNISSPQRQSKPSSKRSTPTGAVGGEVRASMDDSVSGEAEGEGGGGFSDSDCESVGTGAPRVRINRVISEKKISSPPQPLRQQVQLQMVQATPAQVALQPPQLEERLGGGSNSGTKRVSSRGAERAAERERERAAPAQKQVMYTKGQAVSAISMKTFTMDL